MAADARTALWFDLFARDRTAGAFRKVGRSADTLGSKIARFAKLAGVAAAAGVVAFATQGVRSFLKFDSAMTESLAIMGNISGPMRAKMETAAREVGKTTRFGADEAAKGYFFLASAGMDAEQSIAAMPKVAQFAMAGMFDLARATDLATDAQSALGLSVKDPERNLRNLTRVTDVLVGANTLANASVEEFAEAVQKSGGMMRQANIPIEQGVAVLAAFAEQGAKGAAGGTLFNATLEQMQRHAINNKDAFEKFGVSVFDTDGNMRNMADVVADLEGLLGGMSDEQAKATLMQLGFNRTALDGILKLMGYSDAIRDNTAALEHMGGVTEEVADKQREAFEMRLQIILSHLKDWGLEAGKILVTTAFEMGETVAEMGRMFSDNIPKAVQTGMLAVVGIAAAAPLVVGAWRKIKSAVETARISYMLMGTTAKIASLSLGAVGIALAAGTTILAYFARQNLEAKARVDELRDSLDRATGAITDQTRELAANELRASGAADAAENLGIPLDKLLDAYLNVGDTVGDVNAVTAEFATETAGAGRSAEGTRQRLTEYERDAALVNDVINEGNEALSASQREHRQQREMVDRGADAQEEHADAVSEATSAIDDQVDALDDLISSLDDMVSQVFDARDASRSFEEALDDARDAAKENGKTLDITTKKGRDNERQLDRLAQAALNDAKATLEDAQAKGDLARGHDEVTAKMKVARAEFIKVATAMGLSKDQAELLADELGLIPGHYEANVSAPGAAAAADQVARLNEQLRRVPGRTRAVVSSDVALVRERARGGPVWPGEDFLVGEDGPEVVRFSRSGMVHSADETRRMRGSDNGSPRGGDTYVYNVTGMSPDDVVRKLERRDRIHGARR